MIQTCHTYIAHTETQAPVCLAMSRLARCLFALIITVLSSQTAVYKTFTQFVHTTAESINITCVRES